MKIYLGHSLAEKDKSLAEDLVRLTSHYGVFIASGLRPWPSRDVIPPEVAEAIDSADLAIFWLTTDGPDMSCVNLEAGYIRNSPRRVPFLIFSPDGLEPSGCLQYKPFVRFDLRDTRITVGRIWDFLHHEYQELPQMAASARGALIALVGIMLMRAAPEAARVEAVEKRQDQLRAMAEVLRGERP